MVEVMAENYHNIWAKKKKMELESKGKPQPCKPHEKRQGEWGRRNNLKDDSVIQSKINNYVCTWSRINLAVEKLTVLSTY